jgi:glycosyltransferase involved in cell wall biosynthesis
MTLDVCVCTHNPRPSVFHSVLQSLARQTLPKSDYHVWIVDNCSHPPIDHDDTEPLRRGGVSHTVLQEPVLGNVYARETAVRATSGKWLVFVDDDNELFDDYLTTVVDIARSHPRIGCFGGKLLPPPELPVERWMEPLLMYVAIKDCGDEVVTKCVDKWGIWEPPTAGAAVHRRVLNRYLEALGTLRESTALGRKGRSGLYSGEDSLMMRGAFALGLQCSYQPRLKLWHHIAPSRLKFSYLLRLIYYFGRSHVILERALGHRIVAPRLRSVAGLLKRIPSSRERACRLAWQWGCLIESFGRSQRVLD